MCRKKSYTSNVPEKVLHLECAGKSPTPWMCRKKSYTLKVPEFFRHFQSLAKVTVLYKVPEKFLHLEMCRKKSYILKSPTSWMCRKKSYTLKSGGYKINTLNTLWKVPANYFLISKCARKIPTSGMLNNIIALMASLSSSSSACVLPRMGLFSFPLSLSFHTAYTFLPTISLPHYTFSSPLSRGMPELKFVLATSHFCTHIPLLKAINVLKLCTKKLSFFQFKQPLPRIIAPVALATIAMYANTTLAYSIRRRREWNSLSDSR